MQQTVRFRDLLNITQGGEEWCCCKNGGVKMVLL